MNQYYDEVALDDAIREANPSGKFDPRLHYAIYLNLSTGKFRIVEYDNRRKLGKYEVFVVSHELVLDRLDYLYQHGRTEDDEDYDPTAWEESYFDVAMDEAEVWLSDVELSRAYQLALRDDRLAEVG